MALHLEIVTAERVVFSDDVDEIVAPGIEGELGILTNHAPLFTILATGPARIKKGSEETDLLISGGFLEVSNNRVTILADVAKRAEDIDLAAAESARQRAEVTTREGVRGTAELDASALRRSLAEIRVVRRYRARRGSSAGSDNNNL